MGIRMGKTVERRRPVASSDSSIHHPDDPRRRAREALEADDPVVGAVWAQLATAEALHRLAKTLGREHGRPARLAAPQSTPSLGRPEISQ